MENLESKFNKIKEIALDQNVKNDIRFRVLNFVQENPKVASPQISPFYSWTSIFYQRQLIGTLTIMILLFGVPVSAKEALPNNFLYPIKIKVTEPLVTLFTSNQTSSDLRSLELASKRLEEAVILAGRNELTPEIEQNLIDNLSKNISAFKMTRLKESDNSSQSANYAINEDSAVQTFEGADNARNIENMELENTSTGDAMLMMSAPAEETMMLKKSPATTTEDLPIEDADEIADRETNRPSKIINPRLQDLANTLNDYKQDLKNESQSNRNDYKLLKAIDKELENLNSI